MEIRVEILKYVELEFKRKFGLDVFYVDLMLVEIKEVYKGLLFVVIVLVVVMINLIVGLIDVVFGGLVVVFLVVDVNFELWRNIVVNEIFDKVFDKK